MKQQTALISASLFLGACMASPATTKHAAVGPSSARGVYVTAEQFNTLQFIPPPASGSDVQSSDAAAIRYWAEHRTEGDCERAGKTFFVPFSYMWGENSPFPQPLPAGVQAFFDRIDYDAGAAAKCMKNRYRRPRPVLTNPCPGSNGGGYSYPSSHAVLSRVFADVLADLLPERKGEFISRADKIAQDRVVIGVHYPSDIIAGKDFAELFHAELLKSESYRTDLKQIRTLLLTPAVKNDPK